MAEINIEIKAKSNNHNEIRELLLSPPLRATLRTDMVSRGASHGDCFSVQFIGDLAIDRADLLAEQSQPNQDYQRNENQKYCVFGECLAFF